MKTYTIIGGVNGVGKSSFTGVLKEITTDLGVIIDVDKIATYNDCPVPLWCQISPNINEKNGPYVQGIKYGQCQPPYDIHPGYLVTGCMGIGDRITFALNSVHSVKELEQRYYSYVSNLRSTTCVSDINESANYGGACFGFTQKEELI